MVRNQFSRTTKLHWGGRKTKEEERKRRRKRDIKKGEKEENWVASNTLLNI